MRRGDSHLANAIARRNSLRMLEGGNDQEKRVKIQPRNFVVERDKSKSETSGADEGEEQELTHLERVKRNMLKQSGVKFPAKASRKEDVEGLWGDHAAPNDPLPSGERSPAPDTAAGSDPTRIETEEMENLPPPGFKKRPGSRQPLKLKSAIRQFKKWFWRIWHFETKTGYFFIALMICVIAVWQLAFSRGRSAMGADIRAAATKERLEVPKDFSRSVDEALIMMREGDPKTALEKLRELEAKQPDVSSLTYLVALAAMRSGDLNLADEKTEASITKKERVSDSLAIQAVIEAMKRANKNYRVMGDPKLRGELLLRQAILADEANPVPYIRLSILLRYQKRNDEALEMLHAGWARLNPVDSQVMVDSMWALIKLEKASDSELPKDSPDLGKSPAALIASAYAAMRRGDFSRAAESLKLCRGMIPFDLFQLVLNDPAFAPFKIRPELAEFIKK